MARKPNLNYPFFTLLAIIILSAAIRLVGLTKLPASLYWEEVAIGYDAFSISQTGKDYHGNFMPLLAFPSFGDYKPPLYFYVVAGFIRLIGPNDLAVRLPSAMAGIFCVWFLYLIMRQLQYSQKESLLGSFILAITPAAITFSRAAFEVNLGLALFMGGIWTLLSARTKPWLMFAATSFFALSMYTYHGFRVISPLMAIGLYLVYRKSYQLKTVAMALVLAISLTAPILTHLSDQQVNQRFAETSFFPESKAVLITNKLREQSGNSSVSRLIFHRYWWWAGELATNYLRNFSPAFLFLEGDNNPRHGVGEFGILYHWQIIALIAACFYALSRQDKKTMPLVVWLLIAPIPIMLTKTNPHALRALPMVPVFAALSAYGIVHLIENTTLSKLKQIGVMVIIVAEAVIFGHFYKAHYPLTSAPDWQYGYRQTIEYVESIKHNYDKIYFTRDYGRPSMYVLWYSKVSPALVQAIEPHLKKDQLELLEYDIYQFSQSGKPEANTLVITAGQQESQPSLTLLKTIQYPDGKVAFAVYEAR